MSEETKNYNSLALKGIDYNDEEFQMDMKSIGVNIPDELLYTPSMNKYVIDEVSKQTYDSILKDTNPVTNAPYTEQEARVQADKYRKDALRNLEFIESTSKEK